MNYSGKSGVLFGIFILMWTSNIAMLFAADIQKAVIMGDSRTNIEIYKQITEKIVLQKPQVVFHTGDLVSNGFIETQWDDFEAATKKIDEIASFFPVRGNHDGSAGVFLKHFPRLGSQTWYLNEYLGLHWIIVDSELPVTIGSEQYRWLKNDLKGAGNKFCILLLHHPIYSSGHHGNDFKSKDLMQLIQKYKVKLVFSGHDHIYERSFHEATYYIVTGGAGAPLYNKVKENPYSQYFSSTYHYCVLENQPDKIQVRVFDLKDNQIDSLTISK